MFESFYIIFENVKIFVFLMGLGRFFHNEEPMYNKVFCLMLVLQKGCLRFAKLFLESILQCRVNSKISFT